jgi:hypothetical protein
MPYWRTVIVCCHCKISRDPLSRQTALGVAYLRVPQVAAPGHPAGSCHALPMPSWTQGPFPGPRRIWRSQGRGPPGTSPVPPVYLRRKPRSADFSSRQEVSPSHRRRREHSSRLGPPDTAWDTHRPPSTPGSSSGACGNCPRTDWLPITTMSSTPAMAAEARMTCSNCSRVIRLAGFPCVCFSAAGRFERGVDSPTFRRFENTREGRRLPQRSRSLPVFFYQRQDLFKRQIQNSAPLVEMRLRPSGARVPAVQVLPRDLDQWKGCARSFFATSR